jgi:dTDP-4-amino-4,6-dideoxygalactose transaminase
MKAFLLQTHFRLQSFLRRLKVYPRLRLDISFGDLAASLFSFLYFSNRKQQIQEINSFWKSNKEVLVTLSVRTSLDLLLQSLNLPPGSEVLMSAVNIRDLVKIVKQHGLVPVPIDISLETLAPELELAEPLISEKTKIFIVAHLFGSIMDLKPYAQLCQKHKILLIEDCAQAFVGSKYYGYEEADVSFFSFGPIKSCTALGGAVTLIQNKTLSEKMKNIEEQYPGKSEFWFLKRVLKYLGLKTLSIPWIYGYLLVLLRFLGRDLDSAINSMTRGFSNGDILLKLRFRPPNRMVFLLKRRLRKCNNKWFENREIQARKFLSLLRHEISCPGSKAKWNSFWLISLLAHNPESLMTILRENGFDATRGNTSLTFIEDSRSDEQLRISNSLQAKHLIQYVLYLPVSEYLSEKEFVRLAKLVNEIGIKPEEKKNQTTYCEDCGSGL